MEMMRARDLLAPVLAAALFTLAGCAAKPSEEACERAVVNIRKLTGETHSELGADRRTAVRSCRAQSNRDTVECYAEARTKEELFGCGGELADAVREAEKKAASKPAAGAAGGAGGKESGTTGSGAGQ
jgi:hypothetical protein